MTLPNHGDALHAVLPYMHDCGFAGDINSHFPDICQRYMPATVPWLDYSSDDKRHVMREWKLIWGLAQEADEVQFEARGQAGYRPDMSRRLGKVWQVLEFKTSKAHSAEQKSKLQIRDVMLALRRRVGADYKVEGYRLFFHSNPHLPLLPVWTAVTLH